MQIDKILHTFIRNALEGIVILDPDGTVCYTDMDSSLTDSLQKQLRRRAGHWEKRSTPLVWELTDISSGKYYRVVSSMVEQEGLQFFCCQLTDVSDYAQLYQEIASYSRQMSDISDFQGSMLAKISASCELCLPELKYFCSSDEAVMYLETIHRDAVLRLSFRSRHERETLSKGGRVEKFLSAERFQCIDGYRCLLSECAANQRRYAVYLKEGGDFNEEYFRSNSLYNVIRLFVENGILREQIVHDSEHDTLTGLYNKGKYLALVREMFYSPRSIAVFNLDVNDLKYVNDNFGHEAGDELIRRAASSIRAVTSEQVLGFRLGGDEFAMIALDLSKDEAEALKDRWERELEALNQREKSNVVIACGMAFAEAPYRFEKLMQHADALMYANKKTLKSDRKNVKIEQADCGGMP